MRTSIEKAVTFPGKSPASAMESLAVPASFSLNFPAIYLVKCKAHFRMLHSKTSLCCTSIQRESGVLTPREKGPFAVSSCALENDTLFALDLKCQNAKLWIHFVGIGGCGLSALAMLALKLGFEVSGSDLAWSSYMDGLQQAGAYLHIGHSVKNMQGNNGSRFPNALVVSSAITKDNVEILHAKSFGIPVFKRDLWLAKLTEHHNVIAISGSHGKSTTASLLAYALRAMGDDLTAVVGAHVPQFPGGNTICGGGQNFVLEADEYDDCFLGLSPLIAVITNIDWEHVDIFQNEEEVKATFRRFLRRIKKGGHLIICGDSSGAYSLLDHMGKPEHSSNKVSILGSDMRGDTYKITTYGISCFNEWHASSIRPNSLGGSDYILYHRGCPVAEIRIQIPGVHNVLNSLAVIASVIALLGDQDIHKLLDSLKLHLGNFLGVSRRFQLIGTMYGCHLYDDYAHHPTEVLAVLQTTRQRFPFKAILAVFQPHTYSRLAALKDDFAAVLRYADQVVVTAVYSAREQDAWNVSGKDLASSIIGPPSEYIPTLDEVVEKLVVQISKDPLREIVILTLGAGDVTMVGPKLLLELQKRLCEVK